MRLDLRVWRVAEEGEEDLGSGGLAPSAPKDGGDFERLARLVLVGRWDRSLGRD